ncbi:MAG: hydrogenase maturation protease [Anaerolineales bacterium]
MHIMPDNTANSLSPDERPFSILIAGLGNPILGDDGVGWRVAEEVSARSGIPLGDAALPHQPPENLPPISIECYALAGLSLMERFIGYDKVILIDSLNTGNYKQGEVVTFTLDALDDLTYGHSASAHDASLKTALKVGRSMNVPLPKDEDVHVVAIEAEHVYDFKEELSPAIEAAVPLAVKKVLELLEQIQ